MIASKTTSIALALTATPGHLCRRPGRHQPLRPQRAGQRLHATRRGGNRSDTASGAKKTAAEGKGGEDKCGVNKKAAAEGKCGAEKKAAEGECGGSK